VERSATEADRERYQTVYARTRGSVAAPTAGLHFTPGMLEAMEARGVRIVRLVLHVGVGTFRPVETEDPAEHRMHSEWYHVSAEAADALNATRAAGGTIWSVGTTVTRTLESVATEDGIVHAGEGWTDIFIRPPYRFRAVDHLVTNFHLPRSTLLMLVSAFGGYELVMRAYAEAIDRGYRFYSYGDAMLLV
jgi:S-adenosylmethionine:tRNA ribosyltransferase-isomerase